MCSKEVNYKKSEVANLLSELSEEMDILFNDKEGGYCIIKQKSNSLLWCKNY